MEIKVLKTMALYTMLCLFCLFGCVVFSVPVSAEINATPIDEDQTVKVTIDEDNSPVYYSITAAESTIYEFFSNSDRSSDSDNEGCICGSLYNENLQLLTESMRGTSGDFHFFGYLEKNKQYYISLQYDWDEYAPGSFEICYKKPIGGLNEISVGQKKQVEISDVGYSFFSFVPDETATYVFSCASDFFVEGELYDADMNGLRGDFAFEGEELRIAYTLNQGKQYYYSVFNGNSSGNYNVSLQKKSINITTITAGQSAKVVLDPGEQAYYGFVPNETAEYTFYAHSDNSICEYLYDESMTELTSDESDLGITYNLEHGKQYYYGVKSSYSYLDDSFTVSLIKGNSLYVDFGDDSITVLYNEAFSLAVESATSSGNIQYEWYDPAGNIISGANTSNCTIEHAIVAGEYSCKVYDDIGQSLTGKYKLTIDNELELQAKNNSYLNKRFEEKAVMEVVASSLSSGNMTYKWSVSYEKNGEFELISEAVAVSYTVESVEREADYLCTVTDEFNNQAKIIFNVRIDNELIVEAVSPDNISVNLGDSAIMTVKASCRRGELHYQWRIDDQNIEGAVSDTYTAENIQKSGIIYCIVTDDYENYRDVFFNINVISGLTASSKGQQKVTVCPGESVTLEVNASVDTGSLSCVWNAVYEDIDGEHYLDVDSKGLTTYFENVSHTMNVICTVSDDYGNNEHVVFTVTVDNSFTFEPIERTFFYLNKGESVTLRAAASCKDGTITYEWEGRDENGPEITISGSDTTTYYLCRRFDEYGNGGEVSFVIYPFDNRYENVQLIAGQVVELPIPDGAEEYVSTDVKQTTAMNVSGRTIFALEKGYGNLTVKYANMTVTYDVDIVDNINIGVLPSNLSYIGEEAFENIYLLTHWELGNAVRMVSANSFTYPIKQLIVTSKDTQFAENAISVYNPFTIICPKGSYAEAYAKNNNISYVYPG